MKINDKCHNGFALPRVLMVILLTAALFLLVSCGDSAGEDKPALNKVEKSVEEIRDTSMEFSGNVAQSTCLECHPAAKEGNSDIDFEKVKDAGMVRGRNMDILKEKKTENKKIK